MAPPRVDAIILCSCGARWGNARRGAMHEDMEAVEHALLEQYVPKMIRHWRLGHRLALGENAPREFLATLARAAARATEEAGDSVEAAPAGRLELGPVED